MTDRMLTDDEVRMYKQFEKNIRENKVHPIAVCIIPIHLLGTDFDSMEILKDQYPLIHQILVSGKSIVDVGNRVITYYYMP